MADIWPEDITDADAPALNELTAAGVGEGDFDGDLHGVPADAVHAYECLEAAVAGFRSEGADEIGGS